MAFPTNPTNGQTASVNGIVYVFDSSLNAWTVSSMFNQGITANVVVANTLTTIGNASVGGTLTADTIIETSSLILKENIRPIEQSLDSLLELSGVIYDRRDGSSTNEPGLIAEHVAEVLPEIVSFDDSGNAVGVKYSKITVYLIESIKELRKEIEQLKKGS